MKKVISLIMAIAIFASICIPVKAKEAETPDLYVTCDLYSQQYILGETSLIVAYLTDENMFDRYDKIIVDLACNKNIVIDQTVDYGTDIRPYAYTETENGYRAELTSTELTNAVAFTLTAITKGDPAVNITAVGITKDGQTKNLVLEIDIPNNKIYEKSEIPHIETELQPPVFGDHGFFTTFGLVYAYSAVTPDEVMSMLSSPDENAVIKYLPKNEKAGKYVCSGDVFALEFEGKLCDFIQVFIIGDANDDGNINSADARLVLRHSANLEDKEFSGRYCDVTNDGEINAADARMILRVAAKIDYFRHKNVTLWENQTYKVGPLKSAAGIMYMWKCTVSDPDGIEVTEKNRVFG